MTGIRLRDGIEHIAPPWLAKSPYLYPMLVTKDAFVERLRQGIQARFPYSLDGPGPADALGPLGRDRSIVRGLIEADDPYRERLLRWRRTWAAAGHAYSIIEALLGYVSGGTSPWVRIVTDSGMWYYGDSTGTRTWLSDSWNWDGAADWTRYWAIVYPGGVIGDDDPWGGVGGGWGDGLAWGVDVAPGAIAGMRQILAQFQPLHMHCEWIIIALDTGSFVPAGPGLPAGDWGQWSSLAADRPPVRLSTARYCDG